MEGSKKMASTSSNAILIKGVYYVKNPEYTGSLMDDAEEYIVYKDDIWTAPENLGSYTDTYAFDFTLSWDITPIKNADGSDPGYTTEFKSAEITTDLPPSTIITKSNASINLKCSEPECADECNDIGKYISYRFIRSSDMYKDISTHTQITTSEFQNQVMHYTGKSWVYKGLNANYLDGKTFYFYADVIVSYYKKSGSTPSKDDEEDKGELITKNRKFLIECAPLLDYKEFKKRYAKYCEDDEEAFRNSIF